MTVARDEHGRFVPGQSGNPGGKPRSDESRRAIGLARELAPEAVERLWQLATDEKVNAATRKDCLVAILDRGLGRPRQTLHVDTPGLSGAEAALEELSDDELLALARGPKLELVQGEHVVTDD